MGVRRRRRHAGRRSPPTSTRTARRRRGTPGSDTLFFHAARRQHACSPRCRARAARCDCSPTGTATPTFPVAHSSGRAAWVQSHVDRARRDRGRGACRRSRAAASRRSTPRCRGSTLGSGATVRVAQQRRRDGRGRAGAPARRPSRARRSRRWCSSTAAPTATRYDLGFQPAAQYLAAARLPGVHAQLSLERRLRHGVHGAPARRLGRTGLARRVEPAIDRLIAHGARRRPTASGSSADRTAATSPRGRSRRPTASTRPCVDRGIVDLAALCGQSDVAALPRVRVRRPAVGDVRGVCAARRRITHIARVQTPTLILVGDNDRAHADRAVAGALPVAAVARRADRSSCTTRARATACASRATAPTSYMRMLAWFDRWVR